MDDRANRLGEYLRARRALVAPAAVGLPGGGTRRVTGLRREEVALLAGISADYYLRLERGRDRNPSPQVLEALGRVLGLDDGERRYLLGLVAPEPLQPRRSRTKPARVPARLHDLLAVVDAPAFVESRTFDVLAANDAALAFSPRLRPGQNRLRSLLLDPEEREFQQDWEESVAYFVGAFRASIGTDEADPRAVELVGELSIASERFRALWARHDVRRLSGGTSRVVHPMLGPLTLHRDKLPLGDVLLVVYYGAVGSADAEKLALLGAVARS